MTLPKDKDKVLATIRANLPQEYEYSGEEGTELVAYSAWMQGIPIAYIIVRFSGQDDHLKTWQGMNNSPYRSMWETMSLRVLDRPGGKERAFVEFNLWADGGWGKFKKTLAEVLAQQCGMAVLGVH